jgi:hypothetical protein
MGSLLTQLKRQKTVYGRRWTIRRDSKGKLTELKLLFNPKEYETYKSAKKMYGDRAIIKILEDERSNRDK